MIKRQFNLIQYFLTNPEKWLYTHGILSIGNLCLPDFLGIGLPQSGTRWLYENLRCHPELYLPSTKELHYFDRGYHRTLRSYANNFKPGSRKVKGEITPGYSRLKLDRIRSIQNVMPDVRLVLLLRNPIDQQWSTARRIFSRVPYQRFDEIDESKFYACFRGEGNGNEGEYIPTHKAKLIMNLLDNWLSVFSREQLYIGYFDDIVKCPKKLLQEIFAHIGVHGDVDWNNFPYGKIINKNPEYLLPKKFREFLEEMHRNDIEMLCERFGAPVEWSV